ncbi:hypothetical protein DSL92_05405 [Billgrantia gudaonensis]|uniref:Prepilin type IV endopeptidase peptidase domain-containing protein n=1 Tax=Billgrantia gudaonensis TaxID=376427 RepID=A0A432JJ09_9GAMM|nr:hypothetical protein DSL92_05405 [Halomonas gudaonensis]
MGQLFQLLILAGAAGSGPWPGTRCCGVHHCSLVTGKEGMGYGDLLLAALGAWLGWQYLLVLIRATGAIIGIAMKPASYRMPPCCPVLSRRSRLDVPAHRRAADAVYLAWTL